MMPKRQWIALHERNNAIEKAADDRKEELDKVLRTHNIDRIAERKASLLTRKVNRASANVMKTFEMLTDPKYVYTRTNRFRRAAPWKKINIKRLVVLCLISSVFIYLTAIFFYNTGLNLLTAQALASHNIDQQEANSLLHMTAHEKKEYRVYLVEVRGPENFQYFDEWKEHKVFTLTLSDASRVELIFRNVK